MTEEEKVGTLVDEAIKRKQRLQNLKKKNEATNPGNNLGKLPPPKFRSYKPQDDSLKNHAIEDAKAGNIENEVQDQLEAAKTKPEIEELDINNLAPRKIDWDLKRDIAKKMEKLQKMTQKAIAELTWERLKNENDLAKAVEIGSELASKND